MFGGGGATTNAANPTQTVTASADSYVSAPSPSTNYGTSTAIRIDGSPVQRAYLRFTVAGLSGQVTRATLRMYATSTLRGGLTARGVADNTWAETMIKWSNAPPVAATAEGSTGAISPGWVSMDVTRLVAGNGTINLAVTNASTTAIGLRSREAGATVAPQLVIETQAAPPPPPPPVTSPPANTSPPTVSGTAQEGQTVTADSGAWSGTQPITFTYQWRRCDSSGAGCADIAGAKAAAYPIVTADIGSS
ncbi:MAG: acid phosphatase type 7, partial [Chloroflexota bacterium]|nr:acid phosphatase type 7 [Chloroflexota bacterium]